jgi:metallo-beta-lactamase family protein
VRIFREDVVVRAQIHTVGGLSAHAGQGGLLRWIGRAAAARPRVVLVHGEERQRDALGQAVRTRFGVEAVRPMRFDTLEI